MTRLYSFAVLVAAASAQAGWRIIARDIGGGALGVACFEGGETCIAAVSQILPAGYEMLRSSDGGVTWATINNTYHPFDALYNVAAYGSVAMASSDFIVLRSADTAATFVDDFAAPAGGQIVRKLAAADGSFYGFAMLGVTTSGDTNGAVISTDGGVTWTSRNIMWANPSIVAIDGSFLNSSWIIVGNVYQTSLAGGKAEYATEVVRSTDGGVSWTTLYSNASVAALGVACLDAQRCCAVAEDADFSYILCTADGWSSEALAFADLEDGAAIVEIAVAPGVCAGGIAAYVAVGGVVAGDSQQPGFWRSCDGGASFTKDATPAWPVANLLASDVDCQPHTANGTQCWATLWDNGGILEPNTYVAKYFSD